MKYCPKCGNKYDNNTNFCLVDGERLPKSDAEAQTLKFESETPTDIAPETMFIFKSVSLELGGYFDFQIPKHTLRITLKDIVEDKFSEILLTS